MQIGYARTHARVFVDIWAEIPAKMVVVIRAFDSVTYQASCQASASLPRNTEKLYCNG
jgi:hypothetical protein